MNSKLLMVAAASALMLASCDFAGLFPTSGLPSTPESSSSASSSEEVASSSSEVVSSSSEAAPSSNSESSASSIAEGSSSSSSSSSESSSSSSSSSGEPTDEEILAPFVEAFETSNPTKIVENVTYDYEEVGRTLLSKVTYTFDYEDGFMAKIDRSYDKLNESSSGEFITTVNETYYLFGGRVYFDTGTSLSQAGSYTGTFMPRQVNLEANLLDFTAFGTRLFSTVKAGFEYYFMGEKGYSDIEYNLELDSSYRLKEDELQYVTDLGAAVSSTMDYTYAEQNVTIPSYGV